MPHVNPTNGIGDGALERGLHDSVENPNAKSNIPCAPPSACGSRRPYPCAHQDGWSRQNRAAAPVDVTPAACEAELIDPISRGAPSRLELVREELRQHLEHRQRHDLAAAAMHHCSTKWAAYLLSIKSLLEASKGNPYPNDIRITVKAD
jgi:hypothetical protein